MFCSLCPMRYVALHCVVCDTSGGAEAQFWSELGRRKLALSMKSASCCSANSNSRRALANLGLLSVGLGIVSKVRTYSLRPEERVSEVQRSSNQYTGLASSDLDPRRGHNVMYAKECHILLTQAHTRPTSFLDSHSQQASKQSKASISNPSTPHTSPGHRSSSIQGLIYHLQALQYSSNCLLCRR